MSTVKSALSGSKRTLRIYEGSFSNDTDIYLEVFDGRQILGLAVNTAELLNALGARNVPADAIVIERGELPEIDDVTLPGRPHTYLTGSRCQSQIDTSDDPNVHRLLALHNLAMYEYRLAHPTIDEAEVIALAELLKTEMLNRDAFSTWPVIARRLVEAGVRAPEAKA